MQGSQLVPGGEEFHPRVRVNLIRILVRHGEVAFLTPCRHNLPTMLASIVSVFRLLLLLFGGHRAVALENLALRQQLAVYKRTNRRPQLVNRDRWFWIILSRLWKD